MTTGRWAILVVCHDRRTKTLGALGAVARMAAPGDAVVVLYDDASSDGTADAVRRDFPDTRLISGDGQAFWNGGLHAAWTQALALDVEAFLWLNDDVALDADAWTILRENAARAAAEHADGAFVLVGSTRDADGSVSYGGFRRGRSPFALRLERVLPSDAPLPIDTFNGNIVLVTRAAVNRIGINDPDFFHNLGDVDYGLRARAAGIPVLLLPGTLGVCALNREKIRHGYGSRALGLRAQWRVVGGRHGLPFASWWRMTRRHSGGWWPLHFLLPYRHLVVPRWRRQ